jgi:AcrR family transcriptional regulator
MSPRPPAMARPTVYRYFPNREALFELSGASRSREAGERLQAVRRQERDFRSFERGFQEQPVDAPSAARCPRGFAKRCGVLHRGDWI